MKHISNYILESQINFQKVYDALYLYLNDGDDWALDHSGNETGTGKECLEEVGSIIDILDFHNGWEEITDSCNTDEDTLRDFIEKNEDKLIRQLEKEFDD